MKPAEWLDRRVAPLLFVAPFLVLFGVFGLYPLAATAWVSLHDWHLIEGDRGFVGVANYVALWSDPHFANALFNTLSIFVVGTVPQVLCALGIAALLDRPLRARAAWHTTVLLPNVASVAAVALIFAQLFGRDYGLVNWLLETLGASRIDWQANVWSAHLGIAVIVVWRWSGYNALLYLTAMQAVPRELYEAAELDGAGPWRSFWAVTVPGIRPTILFTTVIATISGLQLFAEPQLFDISGTSGVGGNDRQFQTLAMFLYENGYGLFKAGYAASVAWVLFLLCAGFGLVNFLLLRRTVGRG